MQIIIPMSGRGQRFVDKGYAAIKPLIEVAGKPIIEYVINLFPEEKDFVFICAEDHLASTNLADKLLSLKPEAKIMPIKPHKLGPVYSIAEASSFIKNEEPVIVNYCDFFMLWDYKDFKKTVADKKIASASVCYRGFHPHLLGPNLYAGVKTDQFGYASEIREKYFFTANKMDTWQQAGTFYFSTGENLKHYCAKVLHDGTPVNGEYYMSLLFNFLIRDGLRSLVYPVDYFCQWGTPEDLEEYQKWFKFFEERSDNTSRPEFDSMYGVGAPEYEKICAYWENYFYEYCDSNKKGLNGLLA
ncbi:MAG: NTP transferase domain-containing protein [Candidatus Liptonbacteria bacterium]|nr:NTP transferase domain-containing protein [Candidatus Liptonbacteria bacterium]